MILVDSSVWINYLRGQSTRESDRLDELLGKQMLAIGDLILTEVLQGIADERAFRQTRQLFESLETIELGGMAIALKAAQNFRRLRGRGISVRKTIDTIIATRCIEDNHILLHSDQDFVPFVKHLGLKSVY